MTLTTDPNQPWSTKILNYGIIMAFLALAVAVGVTVAAKMK